MGQVFVSDTYPKTYYDAALEAKGKDALKTRSQIWLSQPRESKSSVIEILTYTFADRAPISSISFDIYEVGAHYEFWYYDSDNTKLPLLRDDYNQIKFDVSSKENWQTWQSWSFDVLPCIATKLEIRMQRIDDEHAPDEEYSLGLKKLAIRRSITTRENAALPLKPVNDILGNTISKTVKDWNAEQMIDGDTYTFWKCEPQISQDAVVCLYLDIRDKYGQSQYFDSIDIDPVYAGSQMNIYSSEDDTVGERKPSFSAYDADYVDVSYETETDKSGETSYGGWMFEEESSKIVYDTVKTQLDTSGSWMVAMSWLPKHFDASTDRVIASVGDTFYVKQVGKQFQFWYLDSDGLKHIDIDFPCDIKYIRTNPDTKNTDSEVRLDFGVDKSGDGNVCVRCRIINTNWKTGEIIDDEVAEKRVKTQVELSLIADSIEQSVSLPDNVTYLADTKEILIPPHQTMSVPLKDIADIEDIESFGDDYDLEATLAYRTDEKYLDGARILLPESDAPIKSVSWWTGDQDQSPSKLSIDSKTAYTNWFQNPDFATAGAWKPEQIDGNGTAKLESGKLVITGKVRTRNLTKFPFAIPGGKKYVFSAIPEFDGVTSWYKTYKLFVYDGKTEQYWSIPDLEVESGVRCQIAFTAPDDASLLSFGFVGSNQDGKVVKWSKPIIVEASEWEQMKTDRVDWFDGETAAYESEELSRYCTELNLNPFNKLDAPLIGGVRYPSKASDPDWGRHKPFDGNVVYMEPGLNQYDVQDWIWVKGGSSFTFSFWSISVNGFDKLLPCIVDSAGNEWYPDKYQYTDHDGGWVLVFARVTLPSDHEAGLAHIAINERETTSYTYLGEMHVYDNSLAFEEPEEWNAAYCARIVKEKMTNESLDKLSVQIANTTDSNIWIHSCSVIASAAKIADINDSTNSIGNVDGLLQSYAFKQEELPILDNDKFLQNPSRYVSPDSYDMSSTLSNALVYGRFREEQTLRGGVTDSMFEAKEWMPVLTGQKLHKGRFTAPNPTRAKFIKIELTQLTAVQYPIESAGISSTYRTFPAEQTVEMLQRMQNDQAVSNDKQNYTPTNIKALSSTKESYYNSIDAYNQYAAQLKQYLYDNPDTEVAPVKGVFKWFPNVSSNDIYSNTSTETTSSVVYTGPMYNDLALSSAYSYSKFKNLAYSNAEYCIYTAQASETLLSIANDFGIADWKLIYDSNKYVNDANESKAVSARIPGYWVLPGQQVQIPVTQVRQIVSDADVDVVNRAALMQPKTMVEDVRTQRPTLNVIGPKFFARPCVHYYDTRTAVRTQSIAYFAAIRELKVQIVDYLSEKDNVSWNFYSMAMPVWHINGGYLTDQEVFVPDFSTGADVAVAETDMMHCQSYYRTVKLISVNRDSLMNRTYFSYDGEPWHGSNFWEQHPELNCVWDDSTPDDPKVYEDNGGAWDSRRFAWGDTWTGTTTSGKEWEVWYDGELVKHIVVNPEDRLFDANGNQLPYRYKIGEIWVPNNALTTLGISLFSLKVANPNNPNQKLTTKLQLVSGRFANDYMINEELGFDDTKLNMWQNFSTSKHKLYDMGYICNVYLEFNNFEQLDIYYKSAYIETGTMRILMKNNEKLDWEDVTSAVGRLDSEYTFLTTSNDLQIRVELYDPQDWFSQIIVVPIYIPAEDCPTLDVGNTSRVMRLVQADGSDLPQASRPNAQYQLAIIERREDGSTSAPITTNFTAYTTDPDVADIWEYDGKTYLRAKFKGSCLVKGRYDGIDTAEWGLVVTE